jgi:hypothetical protein
MKNIVVGAVVVFVVGAGIGFYGGMKYQSNKAPMPGTFAGRSGQNGGRQSFGGMTIGTIISKDASSITLQLASGQTGQSGSRIVLFSGTTEISKFDAGTAGDLKAGSTVMVRGTQNSDGSLTAQQIQLRPAMPSVSPQAETPNVK